MINLKRFREKLATAPISLIIESLPVFITQDRELLFAAISANRLDIVKLISYHEPQNIQKGANLASKKRFSDIENYLVSCLVPRSPEHNFINSKLFFIAAATGNFEFIAENQQFLNVKSPELSEFYQKTALIVASENHQTRCVKYLLAEQGNRYRNGKTALMIAAENGFGDICALLVKEVKMQDNYGWNALMYAVFGRHRECYTCLKAEIGQKNEFGQTARDIGKKNGQNSVLDIMC